VKFPDFIILGAAKCGTTALWYNLDKHPDITMVSKSSSSIEMNFWKGPPWNKGLDWYKKKFVGDFTGEKSTMYYLKRSSMRKIKKHIPDVKLILCVRNPTDRAYSNWQMNFKAGKVSNFTYDIFTQRYALSGKYMYHIKNNVLPFFDKNKLHIYVSEYAKRNPKKEMNKVFDFLGVSHLDLPRREIDGQLLKNRSRQEDIKLNRQEKFYRVWSKHSDRLTGPLRNECLKFFRPFNKKFFDYLGYEIKEWSH